MILRRVARATDRGPAPRVGRTRSHHRCRQAEFTEATKLKARLTTALLEIERIKLVGDFQSPSREWRPKGDPGQVRDHDFLIQELGRVVAFGVYDLSANAGWVNVRINHDTAAFAV